MLGAAVGLAADEAIIASVLPRKLAAIPNVGRLGLGNDIAELNDSIVRVHSISVCMVVLCGRLGGTDHPALQNVTLRDAVLHAWARSIATTWMVATGLAGVALILTLFLREYSVDRKTVYSGEVKNASASEKTLAEPVEA